MHVAPIAKSFNLAVAKRNRNNETVPRREMFTTRAGLVSREGTIVVENFSLRADKEIAACTPPGQARRIADMTTLADSLSFQV
jgi:hypothetical protein